MSPVPIDLSKGEPFPRPTILVVDDDDDVRSALTYSLVRQGFRVLGASDGAAAALVSATCPEPIDLALVDLDLPSSDGVSAVRRLRLHRPFLRHIYITGHTDTWLEERGWTSLDGCVLHKPVSAH